jgi:hypothetical protein
MKKFQKLIIYLSALFYLSGLTVPLVFAGTFSDVDETNPYYTAIENLANSNIIQGYDDGTFKPGQEVNRAEALKIILKSANMEVGTGLFNTGFPDVPIDSWYAGYVMQGLMLGIINGNPDGTFAGARTVNTSEYLKMTLETYNTDISKHLNLAVWIASDTPPDEWYSPYLSYGKTIGLIYPDLENNLYPSKNLTRGECAQIIYKILLIQNGGEAQKMVSIAETKLVDAIISIHNDDIPGALNDAEAALYYSETALNTKPDSTAIKATNLIAQAFQRLFYAYEAGLSQNTQEIISLVQEANGLANQAVDENESATYFAEKIKEYGEALLNQLI